MMRNFTPCNFRAALIGRAAWFFVLIAFTGPFAKAQFVREAPRATMAGQPTSVTKSSEPGLLFYLSGDKQTTADFAAGGQNDPNYLRDVKVIPNGAFGPGFEASDTQLMSYWAPGNIYAQRGTVSFFWRSRYAVGATPFPVFRVGYADHSSWDMVWLRIDYNGSGFDAFVTDIGLTRTRVSHYMDVFPKPDQWTHIAMSWDETEGIKLYINGNLVQKQSVTGNVYDTGLDQFGPHSRVISPYQVQSEYNFVRGGDLDELRIYDRMLSDDNIKQLAKNERPTNIPSINRDFANRTWRDEWWKLNGWNLPNQAPAPLTSAYTTVRKVEIDEAIDVRKWMWNANDGIRETTWPGVYNMSRLPGRYDYFTLPDWDTYSLSGQSIRFTMPNEPWNHIEVWGKAWGQLTIERNHLPDTTFSKRSQQQIKSYHDVGKTIQGGVLRYDNALKEEPIGELSVYNVHDGKAPDNRLTETFTLSPAPKDFKNATLNELAGFIDGRYPEDERAKMIALAPGAVAGDAEPLIAGSLPYIHILVPYGNHPDDGLDGVEITLPALPVKATHNGLFPMNIRVKDPLWQMRDLADFSFSVKPNEAHTLWIDTRDRVLPDAHALYISLSGAGADLTPALLKGAKIRLIYKTKKEAAPEHELDRFTQMRALYDWTIEEKPTSPRLNLANRFYADMTDLMKVNPNHWLGNTYKYAYSDNVQDRPEYKIAPAPKGVPQWAYMQTEYLKKLSSLVQFYIDERQISNGEFGGGLSDDDDFSLSFPAVALMGGAPDKIVKSLRTFMKAFDNSQRAPYDAALRQPSLPLFTNGIATIQADMLHAYEDGIEATAACELLDYGNPTHINRSMGIGKQLFERVTQVNSAGHRHFVSKFYGGTTLSTDDPWQWSAAHSYNLLHTPYLLSIYNGNPSIQKMLVQFADGFIAHADANHNLFTDVNFATDEVRTATGAGAATARNGAGAATTARIRAGAGTARGGGANAPTYTQVFKAAYDITGDKKYLEYRKPLPDTRKFNKDSLTALYTERVKDLGVREFMNTVGPVWIDRIVAPDNDIQTDRLGGVALTRLNITYPLNFVGWKIAQADDEQKLAIFVNKANNSNISLIGYNIDQKAVSADMSVWNIKPGKWKVVQGVDGNDDQKIDMAPVAKIVDLEPGESLKLNFPPRKNYIVTLELVKETTPINKRTDLGIAPDDVKVKDNKINVRVYNVSSFDSPATTLQVKDAKGLTVATVPVAPIKAPLDLVPKWVDIVVTVSVGTNLSTGSVTLDPEKKILQITRLNDTIKW